MKKLICLTLLFSQVCLAQVAKTLIAPSTLIVKGATYLDTLSGGGLLTLDTLKRIKRHTAFTPNSFVYPGTTGTLYGTAAAGNGQILIGSTSNAPVLGTITGTSQQISIAQGAGTLGISIPTYLTVDTVNVQGLFYARMNAGVGAPNSSYLRARSGLLVSATPSFTGGPPDSAIWGVYNWASPISGATFFANYSAYFNAPSGDTLPIGVLYYGQSPQMGSTRGISMLYGLKLSTLETIYDQSTGLYSRPDTAYAIHTAGGKHWFGDTATFTHKVTVQGTTSLAESLSVGGATFLYNTLDVTGTSTLTDLVTANGGFRLGGGAGGANQMYSNSTNGYVIYPRDGSSFDFTILNGVGNTALQIPGKVTGSGADVHFPGRVIPTYIGTDSTFPVTLSGMSSGGTGTWYYSKVGYQVTIRAPILAGTSNATSMELANGTFPTELRPSSDSEEMLIQVIDNGNKRLGSLIIENDGGAIFTIYDVGTGDWSPTGFTNSGSKGINLGSFSYLIGI